MARIEEFLKKREEQGLLRSLNPSNSREDGKINIKGKCYIDFCSNDYLGLSSHPELKKAFKEAAEKYGISASASRLLSGDTQIHQKLEEKTAVFKGKESALIFNSGYQANVGIISSLYGKGDVIFSDKLNHASIIDGALLSGAKFFRFLHNDLNHLESLLKKERNKFNNSLIVTETVFSMGGDIAPLKGLISLKEKYNCEIMVDEAHATGIFGKNGSGMVEELGVTEKIDLIMGTFSKALGGFGAYLACKREVKDFLINTCRSFIYSTALPVPVIAANLAALDLIKKEPFRRKTLLENAKYLHTELSGKGFKIRGSSQIIPLIIGDAQETLNISQQLKTRGYWVLPIRQPTVPTGQARLRFSLSFCHSKKTLKELIDDIVKVEIYK